MPLLGAQSAKAQQRHIPANIEICLGDTWAEVFESRFHARSSHVFTVVMASNSKKSQTFLHMEFYVRSIA